MTITRNDAEGLERTARSVLSQVTAPNEWFVIDGGSTDRTPVVIEALCGTAVVISEPDNGIYDAMNKGLALVECDYTIFMNGGDTFAGEDSVGRWLTVLEGEPSLAVGQAAIVGPDGDLRGLHALRKWPSVDFLMGLNSIPHQAAAIRTDELRARGGFDASLGVAADQAAMYRVSLSGRVVVEPHVMARRLFGGISFTRKPWEFPVDVFRMRQAESKTVLNTVGAGTHLVIGVVLAAVFYAKGSILSRLGRSG